MALDKLEDVLKVEELLNLRDEIQKDESLKGEILKDGIRQRLSDLLAVQTTQLGRIEANEEFTEILLRKQDAERNETLWEKYKDSEDKERNAVSIPIRECLRELKSAHRQDLEAQIKTLQDQLANMDKHA